MPLNKVHITFDYELFFGARSGSVEKCLLEPTERLRDIAKRKNCRFVFFIDAGYLVQLENYRDIPECNLAFELVAAQIKQLVRDGHEAALHVHPHWEDCKFENGSWEMNTERYRLSDFSKEESDEIVRKYHRMLMRMTGVKCKTFRAGGWCVQPFSRLRDVLLEEEIYTDSSVFHKGYHDSAAHAYDFRNAPGTDEWRFGMNECEPEVKGPFREIPITWDRISPVFYYSLYLKMKLDPARYRPLGDGVWLKDKARIYRQFRTSSNHFACSDGYFSSRLISIFDRENARGMHRMNVLGHPKSMAECSFYHLERFIDHIHKKGAEVTVIS